MLGVLAQCARRILSAVGGLVGFGETSPRSGNTPRPCATVDRDQSKGEPATVAQKTTVQYLDDLNGEQAAETITFSIDRVSYAIDLSAENATALREDLATWVEHARRTGGRRTTTTRASRRAPENNTRGAASAASEAPPGTGGERNATVRHWARSNGHEVSARGRIPATVLAAFNAAH